MYEEFGAYGSEKNALRALERRRGGFTARQYAAAFDKATRLLRTAKEIVGANAGKFWEQRGEQLLDFAEFDDELKEKCPGFRLSTYRGALAWVSYWHHLR